MTTVAVIGTGYVGLTTAACLAHLGHSVLAADIDEAKVAMLEAGNLPILEDGLEPLVRSGLEAGRLGFTTDVEAAVEGREFVFLCLPTPQQGDGSTDLSTLLGTCRQISRPLGPGAVVVTKSTVPVGAAAGVVAAIDRPDVHVASNPEFLREGTAVSDFLNPDRVVIGADDPVTSGRVANLYRKVDAPVVQTDPASAETIKYAANAFLATKVSFVNAVANLCRVIGADVSAVMEGIGHDRRIGLDHLRPGPGWGGSCFPKDTAALIRTAEEHGYDFRLLREVIAANDAQIDHVFELVARAALGSHEGSRPARMEGRRVAVWGLTYKAGTDDLRESPAIAVVRRLRQAGAVVAAYDPTRPAPDRGPLAGLGVINCDDPYAACERAYCLAVLTEWGEFARANLLKAIQLMDHPAVVDTRNVLDPDAVRAAGGLYEGMGRA